MCLHLAFQSILFRYKPKFPPTKSLSKTVCWRLLCLKLVTLNTTCSKQTLLAWPPLWVYTSAQSQAHAGLWFAKLTVTPWLRCYRRLCLTSKSVLVFFRPFTGSEEANCHQSYDPRKLNDTNNHMSREVAASLAEPPDESPAPVTILRAASRDPNQGTQLGYGWASDPQKPSGDKCVLLYC